MALVEQIASEANNVNVLLDELKHTSRIRPLRRRELLQRALEASLRGVEVVAQEPGNRGHDVKLLKLALSLEAHLASWGDSE
jgi:hypothetical protein